VIDSYEYDAFGNKVNSTGTTPNNYLYRGEQYDPDLSLYYLRARYYNPVTGRFLSVDSEAGDGQRRYEYAGADPINGMDPSGNEAIIEFALLQFYPGRLGFIHVGFPSWCSTPGIGSYLPGCSEGETGGGTGAGPGAPGGPPTTPCNGPNCKHLVLDRTTFEPHVWGFHVIWTLRYDDGSPVAPDRYYVMEQQNVHWLARRQDHTISPSGRSYDFPNSFDDTIQTFVGLDPVDSLQSFAISLSKPNYDGWAANAMHVPIRIGETEYCGDAIHLVWGGSTQRGATCKGAQ
jgi:RHS repeat-associated protein